MSDYRTPTDEEQEVAHEIAKRTLRAGLVDVIKDPKMASIAQPIREMGYAKYIVQTLVGFMRERRNPKPTIREMIIEWVDEELAAE